MLELLIPSSALPQRALVCTVPGCGTLFPMEQTEQFTRHVKACAKRNFHRFEEKVAERESNYFTSPVDKERYEFERRRGEQKGRP